MCTAQAYNFVPRPEAHGSQHPAAQERPDRRAELQFRRETVYTGAALVFTMAASVMLADELGGRLLEAIEAHRDGSIVVQLSFIAIVYFLIYGNLVYQLSRLGYLSRLAAHRASSRGELEEIFESGHPPSVTVLVPAYREEQRVVLETLLSAALVEYPRRRIVLLIDDPPNPDNAEHARQLADMRRLPGLVRSLLDEPERLFARALKDFRRRVATNDVNPARESQRLAELYTRAAAWFEARSGPFEKNDHTDALFVRRILLEPAAAYRARARELESFPGAQAETLSARELHRQYCRLASLFAAEITSFERKRFVNLSHASNKAMNLNSYMSLMGGSFHEIKRADGVHLEPCDPSKASLRVADSDYVLTLDADTLLLSDYALKLIRIMEQPENRRVAVAQTPYSAVPGTPIMLERVAGATTDVQHIIHQGTSRYQAAYWVGANALIRKEGLEDICEVEEERGYPVVKYIQDRTVIEDTESTVDLIARGWKLYNYPERLAYTVTPPDFGALVIQRRRWANGGLIIVGKLITYLCHSGIHLRTISEGFIRLHYLTSPAGAGLGMLILLAYPFEHSMRSFWLPLTALPFYWLYGRDLVQSGYTWADLPRVYALNLLLVPINLGGVFKSVHQSITGRKSPFRRTPKVRGRTAAPRLYVVLTLIILHCCLVGALVDMVKARWIHAAFALFNGGMLAYALFTFVGVREAAEDIGLARPGRTLRHAQPFPDLASALGEMTGESPEAAGS